MSLIENAFGWLDGKGNAERDLIVGVAVAAIGALGIAARTAFIYLFRSNSRFKQWQTLAKQFHDIAERDNQQRLPTSKKKVYVTDHLGAGATFLGGTASYHAGETEALSRIAGNLLVSSRIKHKRYWFKQISPAQRWVDFVAAEIENVDREFARDNLKNLLLDDKNLDLHGRYFHFDVFHFASYLVCSRCASFERVS